MDARHLAKMTYHSKRQDRCWCDHGPLEHADGGACYVCGRESCKKFVPVEEHRNYRSLSVILSYGERQAFKRWMERLNRDLVKAGEPKLGPSEALRAFIVSGLRTMGHSTTRRKDKMPEEGW